jgi:hypothetical protein
MLRESTKSDFTRSGQDEKGHKCLKSVIVISLGSRHVLLRRNCNSSCWSPFGSLKLPRGKQTTYFPAVDAKREEIQFGRNEVLTLFITKSFIPLSLAP